MGFHDGFGSERPIDGCGHSFADSIDLRQLLAARRHHRSGPSNATAAPQPARTCGKLPPEAAHFLAGAANFWILDFPAGPLHNPDIADKTSPLDWEAAA